MNTLKGACGMLQQMHGVLQQVHCGAQPRTIPEISVQPAKITLTSEIKKRALGKICSAMQGLPNELCRAA